MAIPEAVRKQGEAADKAVGQIVAQRKQQEEGQQPVVDTAAPADLTPAPAGQPQAQPAPASPLPPEKRPNNVSKMPDDGGDWRQRYLSLQGVHAKDLERLKGQLNDRDTQIGHLVDRVAELTERVGDLQNTATAQAASQPVDLNDLGLSEEQIEEWGPELLNTVLTISDKMVAKRMAAVENRIEQNEQRTAESAKDRFFRELGEAVPDWGEYNEDPGYLGWLSERDGLSMTTRRENLVAAYNALDADAAIGYFNAYKESLRTQGGAGGLDPDTNTGTGGGDLTSVDDDGGPAPIKASFIKDFYRRVRERKVTPDEAASTEQKISAAMKANRVIDDL